MSRIFHQASRPHPDELELSRTLELATAALGDQDQPIMQSPLDSRVVPNRQCLAAVAFLGEREPQLSAIQRLALVDAAAWWLSQPNGGEQLAYALFAVTCSEAATTEHAYLALITPSAGQAIMTRVLPRSYRYGYVRFRLPGCRSSAGACPV